ncbi:MAG: hypothetical protein WDN69_30885 [Aliidongia sp.]
MGGNHDLVVRGGTIADGDGRRPARGGHSDRRRQDCRRRTGDRVRLYRNRRQGLLVTPGFGRYPYSLRRPGDLGFPAGAVELARRHHGSHGQLRRGLRAGASSRSQRLIELMEGVEDIPGRGAA